MADPYGNQAGGYGYNPYNHGYYTGQSHGFGALGQGIGLLIGKTIQRRQQAQQVQGLVDAARRLMITDPATGKQKPWFTNQQLDPIQRLLDQHQAQQAGQLATFMGINNTLSQRVQAADQKAQWMANPRVTINGIPYLKTPQGGLKPDTGEARSPITGETVPQQTERQFKSATGQRAAQTQQNTELEQQLAKIGPTGISRFNLFDDSAQTKGTFQNGQFVPQGQPPPAAAAAVQSAQAAQAAQQSQPFAGVANALSRSGVRLPDLGQYTPYLDLAGPGLGPIYDTIQQQQQGSAQAAQAVQSAQAQQTAAAGAPQADPTHVMFGYAPPQPAQPADKATGRPYIAAKPGGGASMTIAELNALQDKAVGVAPPVTVTDEQGNPKTNPDGTPMQFSAQQALNWWRNEDNRKKDPELANKVYQQIMNSVTAGATQTTQPDLSINIGTGNQGSTAGAPVDTGGTTSGQDEGEEE
jgi:hypothetical protein